MNLNAILILLIGGVIVWWLYRLWQRHSHQKQRELVEDALKAILEARSEGENPTVGVLATALNLTPRAAERLIDYLVERGLANEDEDRTLTLTPAGQEIAEHVLKAHRLLERYLADEAHLSLREVHATAHRLEHTTRPQDLRRLEAHLGFPAYDPHGDPIPRAGEGWAPPGNPLAQAQSGAEGVITHLEDEPPQVYAELVNLGLHLGQKIRVLKNEGNHVLITTGEKTIAIPSELAKNVSFAKGQSQEIPKGAIPLAELPDGTPAEVVDIAPWIQGYTRRRLMDLGITPGAVITPELRPFFGDPRAYRIRGTLIALREDQAKNIWVTPKNDKTTIQPH